MPARSAPEPAIAGRTAREIALSVEERIRAGNLRPRGLISSAGRRGTRVNEQPPLPVSAAPFVPPGARDLATGNPDPELLPPLATALAGIEVGPRPHPRANKLDDLVELATAAFAADDIPTTAIAVVAGALDGVERVLS